MCSLQPTRPRQVYEPGREPTILADWDFDQKVPAVSAVMIQGTGSNVGKSLLVAGLCRLANRRGISVAPFKPQNMSNNAAVTADGGEIGRAQALQAQAAGIEPVCDLNPVLLKPQTDTGAQIIVHGRRHSTIEARAYFDRKPLLIDAVMESYCRLSERFELIIVEGAGSPAEVNLRPSDIANMGFAERAGCPVVLAGDIDRGGVIAQIAGTQTVLSANDGARIEGFLINKFRGDPSLFEDGYRFIEAHTGWRGFGVIPFFPDAARLPAEDALDVTSISGDGPVTIAWLAFSRVANFDDLDPLKFEPGGRLIMVRPGDPIPAEARLVILPGTKSTRGDLAFMRAQGWDIDLLAHTRRGGRVLGLCGGYQMLGQSVEDPGGVDGPPGVTAGLGLLDIRTVMAPEKRLAQVEALHVASGQGLSGYEIHIGRTSGASCDRPFASINGRHNVANDGAVSSDGRIAGTYLHGIFASDEFRRWFLTDLGAPVSQSSYRLTVERAIDDWADHLEAHCDIDGLLGLAR